MAITQIIPMDSAKVMARIANVVMKMKEDPKMSLCMMTLTLTAKCDVDEIAKSGKGKKTEMRRDVSFDTDDLEKLKRLSTVDRERVMEHINRWKNGKTDVLTLTEGDDFTPCSDAALCADISSPLCTDNDAVLSKEAKHTPDHKPLPEELSGDDAMRIWKKMEEHGYVDQHFQPTDEFSRSRMALFACLMLERFYRARRWSVLEKFWSHEGRNLKYLRQYCDKAMGSAGGETNKFYNFLVDEVFKL